MGNPRVVIATPSLIAQAKLQAALTSTQNFDIAACTRNLSETYVMVESLMPEFVVIAEALTKQEEYQCMLSLFRAVQARVVQICGDQTGWGQISNDASGPMFITMQMSAQDITAVLNALPNPPSIAPAAILAAKTAAPIGQKSSTNRIILIGASTGGIDALTTILPHLPLDCPPTAIVQHTGQNFSQTLARLLDRHCAADIVLAETGLAMIPGRVCLAGGIDGHLRLASASNISCRVERGPAVSGHLPSVDALFMSALPFASQVIAVLLTGMGRDGADGLLALRKAGAITIGQDEASSVVYGMPRVAQEIGAVQHQLPLSDIGPSLLQFASQSPTAQKRVGT